MTDILDRDNIDNGRPEPIQGDRGASILVPRNIPLEQENLSLLASPATDSGSLPDLNR